MRRRGGRVQVMRAQTERPESGEEKERINDQGGENRIGSTGGELTEGR